MKRRGKGKGGKRCKKGKETKRTRGKEWGMGKQHGKARARALHLAEKSNRVNSSISLGIVLFALK